jgi:hypothetical protein
MTLSTHKVFIRDTDSGETYYKHSPDMEIFVVSAMQKMVKPARAKSVHRHSLENVCRAMKGFLRNEIVSEGTLRLYHQRRVAAFLRRHAKRQRALNM